MGRNWVKRVENDVAVYIDQIAREETFQSVTNVVILRERLQKQLDEDWDELRRLIKTSGQVANSRGARIAQLAGVDVAQFHTPCSTSNVARR
jgi:hypothetical protein